MKIKFKRPKKRSFSILLTVLTLGLVVYFTATLIGLKADIKAQAAENAQLQEQLDDQLAANREVEAIINSDDKDAFMELIARQNGYADPDEIVYYTSDAS